MYPLFLINSSKSNYAPAFNKNQLKNRSEDNYLLYFIEITVNN